MSTLLLRNALLLATMDDARREMAGGAVLVRDGLIEAVGPSASLPAQADQVIDCSGCLVMPGMVNTHHHFFQTLTRAVPAAQDAELFSWLTTHYRIWAGLTPQMLWVSTQTAMAELVLSGCTTTSDHLYLYPNGCRLDDCIEAARAVGVRFHAARGAMTLGQSQGGLPPDGLCESEPQVLREFDRLIGQYHDPGWGAMTRIVIAPCSPFSVSRELMHQSALLARAHGVHLHTHLAENDQDIRYTREQFGCTPAQYCEALGWLGPDVWHAHCVKLDDDGLRRFAATGTGVSHCPSSNMRLGSGIAPVRAMLDAGVPVSIGVDGSASNDGSHMLNEVRQAMLLQRVGGHPAALSARAALECATRGGARVLGRPDIGVIAPGRCADLAVFDLGGLAHAGALHDPLAALVLCAPAQVRHSVIGGRVVVREGELQTLELPRLVAEHNRLAASLAGGGRA
jgi:8-oxoguanine deaminase